MAKAKKTAATKKSASPAKTKTTATKKVAAKSKSTAGSAFMKPLQLSAELQKVVGKPSLPRTEVTKSLWIYIKKHNLQDPKNKRNILADENLRAIFGKPSVSMFEMTKLISKHMK